MFKKEIILILFFLFGSANALAVDLRGQIATSDGTPICALVLASGRTTFSCNPRGPFELSGLPTEPDGSITLQVYADGFFPNVKSIRDFSFQNVVMQRAQGCSIDDGLSDTSPLDGVYTFLRSSAHFNDDFVLDTTDPRFDVSGSWTFSGNTSTQTVTVSVDGGPPISSVASVTFEDYITTLRLFQPGFPPFNVVLVERGDKLVTLANANVDGDPFAEVDQWKKVAGPAAVKAMSAQSQDQFPLPTTAPPGSLFGELLETYGLRQVLPKQKASD